MPLLALDAPRVLSRGTWVLRAVVLAGVLIVVGAASMTASRELPALPAVALLHSVLGAFVSAVTAMLLVEHAKATGRRGFLAIGVTYLYLAFILAVFPLSFNGALLEDRST
jgi:hypothetical protein